MNYIPFGDNKLLSNLPKINSVNMHTLQSFDWEKHACLNRKNVAPYQWLKIWTISQGPLVSKVSSSLSNKYLNKTNSNLRMVNQVDWRSSKPMLHHRRIHVTSLQNRPSIYNSVWHSDQSWDKRQSITLRRFRHYSKQMFEYCHLFNNKTGRYFRSNSLPA